jgi:two-component system, OmpR family, sensor kinase
MTLSLRGRLLIGVISLVVVGLLISDIATYATLQSSLMSRIDQQLAARSTVETAVAVLNNTQCQRRGPGSSTSFPAGTIAELISSDGTVSLACRVQQFGSTTSSAEPELPKPLRIGGIDTPSDPITVEGTGGVSQYRITAWPENSFPGQIVVFAIPLTETQSTLSQLLLLELSISLAVVAATGILAFLIIRISLRPLERMGPGHRGRRPHQACRTGDAKDGDRPAWTRFERDAEPDRSCFRGAHRVERTAAPSHRRRVA